MTDGDGIEKICLLKTDCLGRVRTTHEQREALLDAYEQGGLSGPEFARVHGINYQTLATWRQKRNRLRAGDTAGSSPPTAPAKNGGGFTLVEASVPAGHGVREAVASGGLEIGLPGGARLVVRDGAGAGLAAQLLAALGRSDGGGGGC
mgnify:CR=1 FL=1